MKEDVSQAIGWRNQTQALVTIGRSLQAIEDVLRACRATGVYPDHLIRSQLYEAYRAAKKLAEAIDTLQRDIPQSVI